MSQVSTDPYLDPSAPANSPSPSLDAPPVVRCFGLTDRGQVREANEDQFVTARLTKAMHILQSSLPQPERQYGDECGHLFLVADGMGGHQGGEQASALAMLSIEEFLLNTYKWFFRLRGTEGETVLAEFQDALRRADQLVHDEAERNVALYGMGTTLTMAYALGADLYVVHVGDSRCYLMRGESLHQLTRDHTLVGELVRRGALGPEEAARHRLRHVIVNVVGSQTVGVEVEVHKLRLEAGDRVLLCTDGLTEMVPDDRIRAVLREEPDPKAACGRLVAEANERGGKDNVTAVVARFDARE